MAMSMENLAHPWKAYSHLQATLLHTPAVVDRSWGTEAALNRILDSVAENKPLTSGEIDRTAISECRREHYQARVRSIDLAGSDISPDPEDALAARQELLALRSKVSQKAWSVLSQVATGYTYAEMAAASGATANSLRVRVLRARRQLAEDAAKPLNLPYQKHSGRTPHPPHLAG